MYKCSFCRANITNEDGYLAWDAVIHKIYGFLCYYCNAGLEK